MKLGCVVHGSGKRWEVGKGEDRWFISLEEEVERMEEEADEERTNVGIGGGG